MLAQPFSVLTIIVLTAALTTTTTTTMGMTEALTPKTTTLPASPSKGTCWLVVDFDGTCTESDTTPLLPKLASLVENDSDAERERRQQKFNELETEFYTLYDAAKKSMNTNKDKMTSLDQALDVLDDASNDVTDKVSTSGILKGIDVPTSKITQVIDENKEFAEKVKLREECIEVITKSINNKQQQWKLGILSINWCPSLIDAVLVERLRSSHQQKSSASDSTGIEFTNPPIWSNSIDKSGVVSLQVPGAIAKKERISQLKSSVDQQATVVVYVGDSSTDLAALLEADVGILIGRSQSTIAIAQQWGVRVIPLTKRSQIILEKGQQQQQQGEDVESSKILWTVDTWSEIGDFLQAIEEDSSSSISNSLNNVLRV